MPMSRQKTRRLALAGAVLVAVVTVVAVVWAYLEIASGPVGALSTQAQEQTSALNRWAAVAEAQTAVAAIRADLSAERNRDRMDRRLRHLGDHLETALAKHGTSEDEDRWAEIEGTLQRLQEQVQRADPAASETLETLDGTLQAIGP